MQKHVRNFRKHYQLGEQDIMLCQICGAVAVDVHHIRGRVGKNADDVSNLIALDRICHMRSHKQLEPYISEEQLLQAINAYL